MKGYMLLLAALVVVVIVAAVFVMVQSAPSVTPVKPGYNLLSVQLTDPPQVPNGTQSLEMAYSSLEVHVVGSTASGWIQSNDTGSIDLLSVLNLSQTLGAVAVPDNAVVDMVRFNVTSANITINGTTYNVTVPSSRLEVNIKGNTGTNSTSGILISMSPTVATILTSNATVFVMVPSLKAIIIGNGTNQNSVVKGFRSNISMESTDRLEMAGANITITGVSLSRVMNRTMLSVTVRNNGNSTAIIKHVSLAGKISVMLNNTAVYRKALDLSSEFEGEIMNASACLNVTPGQNATSSNTPKADEKADLNQKIGINASLNVSANVSAGDQNGSKGGNDHSNESALNTTGKGGSEGDHGNATVNASSNGQGSDFGDVGDRIQSSFNIRLNSSVCTGTGFTNFQNLLKTRLENMTMNAQRLQTHFQLMTFLAMSNGTLALPQSSEDVNDSGYALASGNSITLSFNGTMSSPDSSLLATPVNGSQYRVVVNGEEGAYAFRNVTYSAQ